MKRMSYDCRESEDDFGSRHPHPDYLASRAAEARSVPVLSDTERLAALRRAMRASWYVDLIYDDALPDAYMIRIAKETVAIGPTLHAALDQLALRFPPSPEHDS